MTDQGVVTFLFVALVSPFFDLKTMILFLIYANYAISTSNWGDWAKITILLLIGLVARVIISAGGKNE